MAALFMSLVTACGGSEETPRSPEIIPVIGDPETSAPDTFGGSAFGMYKTLNGAHSVLRAREKDLVDDQGAWSKLLNDVFDSVHWDPVFTGTDDTTRLNEVLVAVEELPAHGLKNDSYPLAGSRPP